MTIKQYGGVFGRNPTFNTLDIDGNANIGDGVLQVDALSKEVGINTNPTVELDVRGTGGFAEFQIGGSNTAVKNRIYGDNNGGLSIQADKDNVAASSSIRFYVDSAEAARFNASGNLAFVSGKGIDFSATAGTGTSELLDDYEEGTWTPATFTNWSTAPTVSNATYTKVGRQVTARMQCLNGVASAGGKIAGLPFTSGTSSTVLFKDFSGVTLYAFAGLPGSSTEINSMTAVNFTGAFWAMTCTYFV